MKRGIAIGIAAALAATGPGFAQTATTTLPAAEEPIPVEDSAGQGSSAPGSASATVGSIGSSALMLVGLVAIVVVGAVAAAADD
jgi:hypothetical protein